jgi:hypothetical protein
MALALPLSNQKKLAQFVDRRHPDYERFKHHWKFCECTYEGGRDWFNANIHPYLKEGTREYTDRLKRAYRFNHTKEVVALVTKYIFKAGVVRNTDDAPAALKQFWTQACLDGSPIDVLMKRVSDWTSINGRVWMVVDSKASQGTISKADEKKGDTRIYSYLVKQNDVLDFSKDEMGKFNWVLYRMAHRDDADPLNSSGTINPRYMLWTREEWILLEEQPAPGNNKDLQSSVVLVVDTSNNPVVQQVAGMAVTVTLDSRVPKNRKIVQVARGENTIGEVPVFYVDHLENEEPYGPPGLIDDIAYLDRAVANYLSNIDAIIQDQTFSQLAMPAQGLMPGEEAYNKMLEMGTKRIFLYDGESQRPPEYLVPDAAQAQLIVAVIKMIIGEIYHSIGMAGERTKQDNAMGIDNSSGVAKAYDFDRMNALLAAKADMLQRAEERLSYLVLRWAGEIDEAPVNVPSEDKNTDSLIKYPDTYDVRGLPDEFEIADNLALLEAPESLRRQQMTVLAEKLFPRLAKDLKGKIETELKSWPLSDDDKMQNSLSTVAKLGDVVGKVATQIGAANGPSGPTGGAQPSGSSKQGQNPGKSKALRPSKK